MRCAMCGKLSRDTSRDSHVIRLLLGRRRVDENGKRFFVQHKEHKQVIHSQTVYNIRRTFEIVGEINIGNRFPFR